MPIKHTDFQMQIVRFASMGDLSTTNVFFCLMVARLEHFHQGFENTCDDSEWFYDSPDTTISLFG